ncbi:uncharacterized protein MONOS_4308 [Monocercomonoides exilis]|uniref:uncharacterized protein n=1 Tax=Monocercomonoides exilis TaxID=2049356 RepID=UPI00355A7B41|nr:hypothetical protein MONOS_4308 [Monocercomonoides exilis]|eukprot:MONOS_4308.1-p1 / transcript=MONOS_4308.1 / gene=MONOS_4308 / organism=Monocercomonoides_exilis_PA203 / gene_product=unspecified product / transcript_product=unspecified product / location=Mono_scaffold00113:13036-17148(+) / protein_length=1137 / sequence_SO=supercontig / SO=protein_coding / is_pseudo=false
MASRGYRRYFVLISAYIALGFLLLLRVYFTSKNAVIPPHIIVFGGAAMDIFGRSPTEYKSGGFSSGTVEAHVGGVGRNIAEMVMLLAKEMLPPSKMPKISLVTPLADDYTGAAIMKHNKKLGIDMSHIMSVPGYPTPTCMVFSDSAGEISQGVCDFRILREGLKPSHFKTAFLQNDTHQNSNPSTLQKVKKHIADSNVTAFLHRSGTPPYVPESVAASLSPPMLSLLLSASLIVLDNNLSPETTVFIAQTAKALKIPLFMVPSTYEGFEKTREAVHYATVVHLNRFELNVFTHPNDPIPPPSYYSNRGLNRTEVYLNSIVLLDQGVELVVTTADKNGICYCTKERHSTPHPIGIAAPATHTATLPHQERVANVHATATIGHAASGEGATKHSEEDISSVNLIENRGEEIVERIAIIDEVKRDSPIGSVVDALAPQEVTITQSSTSSYSPATGKSSTTTQVSAATTADSQSASTSSEQKPEEATSLSPASLPSGYIFMCEPAIPARVKSVVGAGDTAASTLIVQLLKEGFVTKRNVRQLSAADSAQKQRKDKKALSPWSKDGVNSVGRRSNRNKKIVDEMESKEAFISSSSSTSSLPPPQKKIIEADANTHYSESSDNESDTSFDEKTEDNEGHIQSEQRKDASKKKKRSHAHPVQHKADGSTSSVHPIQRVMNAISPSTQSSRRQRSLHGKKEMQRREKSRKAVKDGISSAVKGVKDWIEKGNGESSLLDGEKKEGANAEGRPLNLNEMDMMELAAQRNLKFKTEEEKNEESKDKIDMDASANANDDEKEAEHKKREEEIQAEKGGEKGKEDEEDEEDEEEEMNEDSIEKSNNQNEQEQQNDNSDESNEGKGMQTSSDSDAQEEECDLTLNKSEKDAISTEGEGQKASSENEDSSKNVEPTTEEAQQNLQEDSDKTQTEREEAEKQEQEQEQEREAESDAGSASSDVQPPEEVLADMSLLSPAFHSLSPIERRRSLQRMLQWELAAAKLTVEGRNPEEGTWLKKEMLEREWESAFGSEVHEKKENEESKESKEGNENKDNKENEETAEKSEKDEETEGKDDTKETKEEREEPKNEDSTETEQKSDETDRDLTVDSTSSKNTSDEMEQKENSDVAQNEQKEVEENSEQKETEVGKTEL